MKKENLEVILEQMNGKFDLVLEGQTALIVEVRELVRKMSLSTHRAVTEAHPSDAVVSS